MARKELSKGLVQVYTGDGKGKTTAALGLGLRASGHGLKVEMIQYMKGSTYSGELYAIERLPNFNISQFGKSCPYAAGIKQGLMGCQGCGECFLGEERKDEATHQRFVDLAFEHSKDILKGEAADLVILDEINNALRYDLLAIEQVEELIELKSDTTELIFTGRGMPERIIELADLVTNMEAVKHPFEQGVSSRWGIEY